MDYWECVAQELEEAAREDLKNARGPRAALHARPSRCGGQAAADGDKLESIPTPTHSRLQELELSELLHLAAAFDASMRLHVSDNGAVEVRSPVRRSLVRRLYRTAPPRRPTLASDLVRSEEMASELALRLTPLGRTFARAHVATQLIYATLAALDIREQSFPDAARLRSAARRIERAAATSTAMLGLAQAGLTTELGGTLLRELAGAAASAIEEPLPGGDEVLPVVSPAWRPVFVNVRPDPRLLPDLEDIGDPALAPSTSRAAVASITPGDARAVPVVLVAVSAGHTSVPGTSAQAVRAVLDGNASGALHWALELSRSCRTLHATLARQKRALELALARASGAAREG